MHATCDDLAYLAEDNKIAAASNRCETPAMMTPATNGPTDDTWASSAVTFSMPGYLGLIGRLKFGGRDGVSQGR